MEAADYQIYHNAYRKFIDRFIASNKSILKVVFFVTASSKWCTQSLYDAFEKDCNFDPLIVVFPDIENINDASETLNKNLSFFQSRGMKTVAGYDPITKIYITLDELQPDIIFYEQPWKVLPDSLWIEESYKRSLSCLLPYGMVSCKIDEHDKLFIDFYDKTWKIFAETKFHRDLYRDIAQVKKNIIDIGYPKVDVYLENTPIDGDKLWKISKTENPNIKRIIWAPHWSVGNENIFKFSTFEKYYQFFLNIAKNNPEIDWIMKPHPSLFWICVEHLKLCSKQEMDSYLQEWEALPNGQIYEEGGYFDLFQTSDALITDSGSFLAEYTPSSKPILLLLRQGRLAFNELGEKLKATLYQANDENDIANFINNVVFRKEDPLKSKRLDFVYDIMPISSDTAGEKIKNYIKGELFGERFKRFNQKLV